MKSTRRTFLKTTASATLATLAVGSSLHANSPATPGRRIAFVDHNLDNYHANVFLKALRGPLEARGFTVTAAFGLQTEPSRAWAEKNQIPFHQESATLKDAADFFMILAPSNPEVHKELCQRVFPFGKPTYVDKTFAPDYATAQELFALAAKHGTPMQTSSALRYTNVQDEIRKTGSTVEHMITWGGGGSYDEYAIHPTELLISVMGPEVTGLMRRGTPERSQLLVNFSGDRTGVINVFPNTSTPFAASFTTAKATRHLEVDVSKIFVNNQAAILDFFESGKPNINSRESLAIMWILETARKPQTMKAFVDWKD